MRHLTIATIIPSVIIQKGIATILSRTPDINITLHDITGENAAREIQNKKPTIIIADPMILSKEDIDLLKSQSVCNLRIIALQSSQVPSYVSKLYDGVISIYDNEEAISSLIKSYASPEERNHKELTQREKEIVVGIVKGLSNKEIAQEMSVSVNTVMTHRRNIAAKLQIHSPAGLTIYAIVSKLVKIDEIKTM